MYMYKLWDHQKKTISYAEKVRDLAIFHEQGTGKTLTAIEIIKSRMGVANRFLNTLVVCPKGTVYNWKNKLDEAFHLKNTIIVLDGPIASRCKIVLERKRLGTIFITNFEGLQQKFLPDSLIKFGIELLIVDESHRLKGYNSKTTRQVQRIADKTISNFIMSGTPILQDERDLFSQFRILDRGESFGRTFDFFKALYMYDKNANRKGTLNYWPDFVIKPEARSQIIDRIKNKMVRVEKKDCMDLPERLICDVPVNLSKQQKRMYNQMAKEWVATIEDGSQSNDRAAIAQMALHKGLRLQQILTGFVKDSDGVEYDIADNPRLETLRDLVVDRVDMDKVVIWCSFINNYKHIEAMLQKEKIEYASLYGETKDKQAEIDRFKSDPKCRVMVANPKAGGTGVDGLQVANTCIYYSKSYSLEDYLQSRDRTYRGGSEIHSKVTEIHLVAPKSIDEVVMKALLNKKSIGDELLNWKFETL